MCLLQDKGKMESFDKETAVRYHSILQIENKNDRIPCPHKDCGSNWTSFFNRNIGLQGHYKQKHKHQFSGLENISQAVDLMRTRQFHLMKLLLSYSNMDYEKKVTSHHF